MRTLYPPMGLSQPKPWIAMVGALGLCAFQTLAQTAVNLSGTVTDSAGTPVSGATVKLERLGYSTVSAANGAFTLTSSSTSLGERSVGFRPYLDLQQGRLQLDLKASGRVAITAITAQGQIIGKVEQSLEAGWRTLALPAMPRGLGFLRIEAAGQTSQMQVVSVDGVWRQVGQASVMASPETSTGMTSALRKAAATAIYDVLTVEKAGFQKGYVTVNNSDSAGMAIKLLKDNAAKFSFFVVSMKAVKELSKNDSGFGGDLRFGETGPGAGLRGADKICATVAEGSMPGSRIKGWRAFLSVSQDAQGKQVNAIDRVGPGPWYDRIGRLLAPTKADLKNVRPTNGDPTIQNEFPNETGVSNKFPDPNQATYDDNHHTLTGSNAEGGLKIATGANASNLTYHTCKDWTVSEPNTALGKPGAGFAWPRGGRVTSQGSHWYTTYDASGCGKGIAIVEDGPGKPNVYTVGNGGGYGAIYCFALSP